MRWQDFEKIVKGRPFTPMEIKLESGERFSIRHPEQIFTLAGLVFVDSGKEHAEIFGTEAVVSIRRMKLQRVNGKSRSS